MGSSVATYWFVVFFITSSVHGFAFNVTVKTTSTTSNSRPTYENDGKSCVNCVYYRDIITGTGHVASPVDNSIWIIFLFFRNGKARKVIWV